MRTLPLTFLLVGCGIDDVSQNIDGVAANEDQRIQLRRSRGGGLSASQTSSEARQLDTITVRSDTYFCLSEIIEPDVRRLMGLPNDLQFGGALFGAIQTRLNALGETFTIAGSSRFLSLDQDNLQKPAHPRCSADGNDVHIALRVGKNGRGTPYRLSWEVRQRAAVRRGFLERNETRDFPWQAPPAPWNAYDYALRQEARLIGKMIADSVRIVRRP